MARTSDSLSHLAMPAAVVIAGACIGLGLYFGLRTRSTVVAPPVDVAWPEQLPPTPGSEVAWPDQAAATPPERGSTVSRARPPTTDATPPSPATPARPMRAPDPSDTETTAAVDALVADVHARWKEACWDSADPSTRKPGRYSASLAFDAQGKLIIFGINEERDQSDPEIARCLRQQHEPFTIPAPGHAVTYDVPFEMP